MTMLYIFSSVTDDANECVSEKFSFYLLCWHFLYNVILKVGESIDMNYYDLWMWFDFGDEFWLHLWALRTFEIINNLRCCFLKCIWIWDCQCIWFLSLCCLTTAFKTFSGSITFDLINVFKLINKLIAIIIFKLIFNTLKQLY
jgi:hypothetical protein